MTVTDIDPSIATAGKSKRMTADAPLLSVSDLHVNFAVPGGTAPAVRGVSFHIDRGESVALVGESGSGKSVTALSILQLLPYPSASHPKGSITYDGTQMLGAREPVLRKIRGNKISMVFQEPMTSLNPTMTVGQQIGEVLRIHRGADRATARREALALLDEVRLPDARRRLDDYPHQFSGGMRQRVVIAIALAGRPSVLLADEPTTALDVTVQAQVLSLFDELKRAHDMGIIFITHNMAVVAQVADRVAVMYAGEIVETAPTERLFAHPVHPYTEALLAAMPRVDRKAEDLRSIPGSVPGISARPAGCRFAPRCKLARPICETHPDLVETAPSAAARCAVRAPKGVAA